MLPIPQAPGPRCDCCGLLIHLQNGDFCPRCGYPVSMPKEEHFLEESIRNLQRIATYGGAQATVTNLLQRYRARLDAIHSLMYVAPAKQNTPPAAHSDEYSSLPIPYVAPEKQNMPSATHSEVVVPPSVERPIAQTSPAHEQNNQVPPIADIPHVFAEQAFVPPPLQPAQPSLAPVPPAPKRMFSLGSFFADQTINIVSSLGAFLILIGSLSFVVTTTNFFLSFLVLFFVHLIFAIVGFVFARFPSFRFISRVYTTIFALLVPLVGFSGYRLVAGHLIQLSAPTVVAIAATYAAIVYALLAVSQQYKPFGYLAGVALVVADLAVAFALQLAYWWWPVLLMPLAFVALLLVASNGRLLSRGLAVLREPMRVLMYACIAVLFLDALCSYLYMIASEVIVHQPLPEIRAAGAVMLLLLLGWTCTYLWSTRQLTWLAVVPYQLLGLIMALAYVFSLHLVACGLLFTVIAVAYHISSVLAARAPRFQSVRNHTEGIALVLVAFVPLLMAPLAPLQVWKMAYNVSDGQFLVSGDTFLALLALLVSCALIVSIVLSHTGLQRIPAPTHKAWPWLLLLSGFLFTWLYSIVVLSLHVMPAYAFLALTLALLIGTIVIRRSISTAWSHPLDILVLGEAGLTLLFHLSYGVDANVALLILFAVLSYSVILSQRRYVWLFVPVVFMLSACPLLIERPRIMLLLAVALPLIALAMAKVKQNTRGVTVTTESILHISLTSLFSWEWPVLVTGLFYGIVLCSVDASVPTSTVQSWLGVPFSVALEMAVLALLWYIVAVLTRQQWMLLVTLGFAFASMLVPSNPVWALVCVACVAALLALGMSCIAAKIWTIPLYAIALAAAVLTGVSGILGGVNHPFATAIPDALLLYALIAYAILVIERQARWLWLVAVFAVWGSVLIAQLNPDVFTSSSAQIAFPTYYLTGVALVAGGIAIVAGRLSKTRDVAPALGLSAFTWSWPWYCTALFAIGVTIVWNTIMGGVQSSGITVYGSLFVFIVLNSVVMLVERRRELSVVPILLMLWGVTQAHGAVWQQTGALSIFFFLVFAMHYVWHLIPTQTQGVSQGKLFTVAGLSGQVLVLLMIIVQGGLSPDATALAHVGIGALLLLAVQLFWYGWTERTTSYWAFYTAGLLVALAVPWELVTFHLLRIEWLVLAPATYLIVIAPFLSRNEHVVHHQRLGQICSILGAALLLLPTLWSSFSDASIQPTFILAGEALALLLLGVALRTRFFVLSGAALVVVSAMHALFLPSLGLPPSLALTIMGMTLLALATALSLARHRLQTVWTHLD